MCGTGYGIGGGSSEPSGLYSPGALQRHKTKTFTVWRITAKKRLVAKLKAIKVELQRRIHDRVADVGAWLQKVVSGYYLYHAVPGNIDQLYLFKHRVHRLWRSVLVRRKSDREKEVGEIWPDLRQMDPNTPHPASLSRRSLLRHSSFVRAVCVNAPVRTCAGGDPRGSSRPRSESCQMPIFSALGQSRPRNA
jgi:hypothetical protein